MKGIMLIMEYYVIVFKNTYDAMNAEKKLKDM